jgi:hypothetical protein
MFNNYKEVENSPASSASRAYADELYISNIRKLYPNMTEEEFNEMFNNFKQEMLRQAEKSKERDASLRR